MDTKQENTHPLCPQILLFVFSRAAPVFVIDDIISVILISPVSCFERVAHINKYWLNFPGPRK